MDSRKLMPSPVLAKRLGQDTSDRPELSSKSQAILDASAGWSPARE